MFSQEHNFFCFYLARPECPQFFFMFSENGLLGQNSELYCYKVQDESCLRRGVSKCQSW